jgi:hypothetical protein
MQAVETVAIAKDAAPNPQPDRAICPRFCKSAPSEHQQLRRTAMKAL